MLDIQEVYQNFLGFFIENGFENPWSSDAQAIGAILKEHVRVTEKHNLLAATILDDRKPNKNVSETFPYSEYHIIRLLAGGTCKLQDLYGKDEYEAFGSLSLEMDDDKMAEIMVNIGDDYELISVLRNLHDWSVLAEVLDAESGITTISEAKVKIYEQHKADLKTLKYFIRKYCPTKYDMVFREARNNNYVAYSYHVNREIADQIKSKADVETFSKFLEKNSRENSAR